MDSAPPATAEPAIGRNVRVLGWTSFWNDVASESIYPIVPIFLTEVLGGSKLTLGLIQGISESVSSLLKLASGALSDRWKARKRWLLAGYSISVLVRPVLSLISTPGQLFAARVADRIGKGLRTAPRDALIVESTAPSALSRAFGFHRAMDHLGAALGPLCAAAFLWWRPNDLRTLFFLTLFPGLLVLGLLVFGLRDLPDASRPPVDTNAEPTVTGRRRYSRSFWLYLAAVSLFSLGNASDAFLLIRLREAGLAVELLPLFWFGLHLLKSLGNRLGGSVADRWSPYLSLRVGWGLYATAFIGFGLAQTWWHFLLPSLLYAAYFGLSEPAEKSYLVRLGGSSKTGARFGWFHGVTGVMVFPASLLFGWLYQTQGAPIAYGAAAGLAVVAIGLLPRPLALKE